MKRVSLLLLSMMFALLTMTARAQSTPTEITPMIEIELESIYPAAIRVSARVPFAAGQIESAQVVITVGDFEPEIINIALPIDIVTPTPIPTLDPNTPEVTDEPRLPTTTLATLYALNIDALPRLFIDDIRYEWTITLINGQTLTETLTRVFTDERFGWRLIDDRQDRLDIRLADTVRAFELIVPELLTVYEGLERGTGDRPYLNWALYLGFETPDCVIDEQGNEVARGVRTPVDLPCPSGIGAALAQLSGIEAFNLTDDIPLVDTLSIRLFDTFYAPYWANADVPMWFEIALRRHYATNNDALLLAPGITSVRTNRAVSLDLLESSTLDPTLREAQAYGLLAYMIDRASVEAVYRLARDVRAYDDFASAYADIIGEPLGRLVANWQRWIFTDNAGAAYAISPYAPITPTPAPITPSATATASATPTITPTATATQPTAIPSLTPTMTPTPLLPSVTPRPASSLYTPTPIPVTATPPMSLNSSAGAIALVALIILIAVLIVVYIRLGRRI